LIVRLCKQYRKTGGLRTVTFSLPKAGAASARGVNIAGAFNDWSQEGQPMKEQKNRSFTASVTVARGREYQFRYWLDGSRWENDWQADRYVANEYASENCVVIV